MRQQACSYSSHNITITCLLTDLSTITLILWIICEAPLLPLTKFIIKWLRIAMLKHINVEKRILQFIYSPVHVGLPWVWEIRCRRDSACGPCGPSPCRRTAWWTTDRPPASDCLCYWRSLTHWWLHLGEQPTAGFNRRWVNTRTSLNPGLGLSEFRGALCLSLQARVAKFIRLWHEEMFLMVLTWGALSTVEALQRVTGLPVYFGKTSPSIDVWLQSFVYGSFSILHDKIKSHIVPLSSSREKLTNHKAESEPWAAVFSSVSTVYAATRSSSEKQDT